MRSVEAAPHNGSLSYHEARVSPCSSCESTPCCQYLPLQTFPMAGLGDVDYAFYLLNFDDIELGIAPDGTWSAYYRQACRFLARDTLGCQLHGTPAKPHVCVQYNPYSCFYRGALSAEGSPGHIRIDRTRLQMFADALTFDDERRLTGAPSFEALAAAVAASPIAAIAPTPARPRVEVAGATEPAAVDQPCDGCGAYCCTTLMFPVSPPTNLSSLDYLRFALGFPGTEVVLAETEWHLAVRTRCRHLDGGRCGVFGTPARPLRCQYYDEWTCGYRKAFAGDGDPSSVRFRLEEFPVLAAACTFDANGVAVAIPTVEELRPAVLACAAADVTFRAPPVARRQPIPLRVIEHRAATSA
jgi:hypothetical protein